MLFFKEIPPPHMAKNVRNKFEGHLNLLNISSFVVTDNAANMKCAFQMTVSNDSDDMNLKVGWLMNFTSMLRVCSSQASVGCKHGIQGIIG